MKTRYNKFDITKFYLIYKHRLKKGFVQTAGIKKNGENENQYFKEIKYIKLHIS